MTLVHIALFEPEIPPNTGNIARLCAALKLRLHLVKPLGFSTEDRYLKRAGLDYWPHVDLEYHDNFQSLQQKYLKGRFYYFTTKATHSYCDVDYQKEDFLVFGAETTGLPKDLLEKNASFARTIPMSGPVRSLNLSTSVAMVTGEAMRQIQKL